MAAPRKATSSVCEALAKHGAAGISGGWAAVVGRTSRQLPLSCVTTVVACFGVSTVAVHVDILAGAVHTGTSMAMAVELPGVVTSGRNAMARLPSSVPSGGSEESTCSTLVATLFTMSVTSMQTSPR